MKITTITTTINVPDVLRTHREMDADVDFIVAGDLQSPHTEIQALCREVGNATYLRPEEQGLWESSEAIGWHCIQRRNICILEAIAGGADVIVTIDDDNFPTDTTYYDVIRQLLSGPITRRVYGSETGWCDPWKFMTPGEAESCYHRGFPYSQRGPAKRLTIMESLEVVDIGVIAGFAAGDPDVDAIERIVTRPFFDAASLSDDAYEGFALERGTWAPFNSQNTAYRVELAPYLMCWPHVGRYDDIWASYMARRVMDQTGYSVHYGPPVVRQDRNDHDLWKDVMDELHGYQHTDKLCERLRSIAISSDDVQRNLNIFWTAFLGARFIPDKTLTAFSCWIRDIDTALKKRGT